MLKRVLSNKFEKDYVRQHKRNKDISKIDEAMRLITNEIPLPAKYKDHPLKGNWLGFRDCHIEGDWVLIYKVSNGIALFERTGTHTDVFD